MEQQHQFPTEEVTLPSKGLLYPESSPLSKGVITMKYMTAREEDILTNVNLIKRGHNSFDFHLPTSKIDITFKLLTHGDEKAIANETKGLRKINKNASKELSTRMKYMITSINGDSEKSTIREFVDNQLLARDARALRNYIVKIQPDVDLHFDYEDKNGDFIKVPIPVNLNFFWPDTEL